MPSTTEARRSARARLGSVLALTTVTGLSCMALTVQVAGAASPAAVNPLVPTAAALGQAAGFSEFSFGDATRGKASASDSQGPVAYGGTATFNTFFTGAYVARGSRSLTVGGDVAGSLTLANGTTGVYGGTSTATEVNGATPTARLTQGDTGIDFAATRTALTRQSATWGAEPTSTTSTVTQAGNVLYLVGTDPSFNVFTLLPAQFASVHTVLVKVPSTATTLVNVPDTSLPSTMYQDFQYWNGTAYETGGQYGSPAQEAVQDNTLLNIPNATEVVFGSAALAATVLAPVADFTFDNGQLDGAVIAETITGDFQSNLTRVAQSSPQTSVLPTSASRTLTSAPVATSSTAAATTSAEATSAAATTQAAQSGVEPEATARTSLVAAAPELPFTGASSLGPLLAAGEATVLAGMITALLLRYRKV